MTIRRLTGELVGALHALQIAEHGRTPGTRDGGALESALAHPKNLLAYDTPSLARLAAAYAFGIARNHPFVDGNKRTAFMAAYVFLGLNGLRLEAPEEAIVHLFLSLASGDLEESELARWIEDHSIARTP